MSESAAEPSASPQNPTAELAILRENLAAVQAMTANELGLIGSRMSWFVISQSFFFGAYCSLASEPAATIAGAATIHALLLITPGIGILISAVAGISVNAAGRVLDALDPVRGRLIQRVNEILASNAFGMSVCEMPVMGDKSQRPKAIRYCITLGRLPQIILPWAMITVWCVVYLVRVL